MKRSSLCLTASLLALFGAVALCAAGMGPPPPAKASSALDRFRALAGDWVMTEDGQPMTVTYRTTAAGTAVVETLFPGTPHEMTTVYTQDGNDLVLTHYCAFGNQPHMRAKAPTGSVVDFVLDGGANLDPAKDPHMHEAKFQFVSTDEIQADWTSYAGGKATGTKVFHLKRKK